MNDSLAEVIFMGGGGEQVCMEQKRLKEMAPVRSRKMADLWTTLHGVR